SGDPRARQYLRAAVRRTDLPDDVLTGVIRALGQDFATSQDAALLREVYPTLPSDHAHEAAINALAEIGGLDNTHWLVTLATNSNETLQTGRRALDAASRAGTPIAELVKLYDTTTDPQMKDALINVYMRSGDAAAVDKLLAIVKGEENVGVRRRT